MFPAMLHDLLRALADRSRFAGGDQGAGQETRADLSVHGAGLHGLQWAPTGVGMLVSHGAGSNMIVGGGSGSSMTMW